MISLSIVFLIYLFQLYRLIKISVGKDKFVAVIPSTRSTCLIIQNMPLFKTYDESFFKKKQHKRRLEQEFILLFEGYASYISE